MSIKKAVSILMALILTFGGSVLVATAQTEPDYYIERKSIKTIDSVSLRDPYVLFYKDHFYMYGTGATADGAKGFGCYTSNDMTNWFGPKNVFVADDDFDGYDNFWAPECHYYEGNFYLIATYKSRTTQHRGVAVFKSSSPLGPFEEISNGHVTPASWDAIDGTLFVDKNGQPWMFFVHEWTGTADGVGRISVAKLSADLSSFITEPVDVFAATDAAWAVDKVTDGPFVYTTSNGKLVMLWSGFGENGYCVGIATPSNENDITAKWVQQEKPFAEKGDYFDFDCGHAMIFINHMGFPVMALHSPNNATEENATHPVFARVIDEGDSIKLKAIQDTEDHYKNGLDDMKDTLLDGLKAAAKSLLSVIWGLIKGFVVGLFNSIKSLF